jgi:Rad52/22 family double-strand break repair protein
MTTLNDIAAQLAAPFPAAQVEVKPGATSEANSTALALAYVDARLYQARLDHVAGPAGWSVTYTPWNDRAIICRLTVLGVTREDVGESEANDPNQATSAAMQAFKRACASFGLGRYLYTDLPQLWVAAEKRGRGWAIKDAAGAVRRMYQQANLPLDGAPAPTSASEPITLTGRITERAVKHNGTTWLRFQIGDELVVAKGDLATAWAKRTNGTPVIVTGVRRQAERLGAYVEATAIRAAAGVEIEDLPV